MDNKLLTARECINILITKSKEQIETALIELMFNNKLSFIDVSNAYIKFLKTLENKNTDIIAEANCCIMQHLIDSDNLSTENTLDTVQQRSLYFLDHSKYFNMKTMKEKFMYDPVVAKKLSHYHWDD